MPPLLMQVFPTMQDLKNVGDLGQLAIVALVAFVLAVVVLVVVFIQFRQTMIATQTGEKDDNRIDKLIDRLVEVFGTLNADQVKNRQVIAENSETQKAVVIATNEQTSETRLLRADFRNYQQLQTETIQNLRDEMVSFKGEIQGAIDKMLEQITVTNNFVERAVNEHEVIITAGKTIISKIDKILEHIPPLPPVNISPVTSPPPADAPAGESDLPRAS